MEHRIKRIHLDLTNRCNLNCSYCYVVREKSSMCHEKAEMTSKEWLGIIDQAVEMGIGSFVVSGGEPLSFPGILEIMERLGSHHAKASLMTNLWKTDGKVMESVIESPAVKEIITSLDGFDGHNIARPPSDWHNIINVIRWIREKRKDCRISVNTVLHRHNMGEVVDLQRKVVELGVDAWRVDLPIRPHKIDILLDFKTAVEIASRLIINRYAHAELQKTELALFRIYKSQLENIQLGDAAAQSDTSLHPCDYFLGSITVKPDGTITLCSPIQLVLGRITEGTSLSDVLGSAMKNNFFTLKVSDLEGCRNCKYLMLCGGGCRADALRWTGGGKQCRSNLMFHNASCGRNDSTHSFQQSEGNLQRVDKK
ncbi:MAG: radical SAM protein [Candidatus Jorgensenbacteria bacterium]